MDCLLQNLMAFLNAVIEFSGAVGQQIETSDRLSTILASNKAQYIELHESLEKVRLNLMLFGKDDLLETVKSIKHQVIGSSAHLLTDSPPADIHELDSKLRDKGHQCAQAILLLLSSYNLLLLHNWAIPAPSDANDKAFFTTEISRAVSKLNPSPHKAKAVNVSSTDDVQALEGGTIYSAFVTTLT
jgi:hypothetical protein